MTDGRGRRVPRLARAGLLAALEIERFAPVMAPDLPVRSRHTGLSTAATITKRVAASTRAAVAEEIAVHLARLAYDEAARPHRDAESRLIQRCLRQAADIARQHGREDTDGPSVPGRPGS